MAFKPEKIIAGSQTGASRAALDAALYLGLDYGGAVVRGRAAEDGPLPAKYDRMTETESDDPSRAQEENVKNSAGTIIFTEGKPDHRSLLAISRCQEQKRDFLHVDFRSFPHNRVYPLVREWLERGRPQVLHIAGSRESIAPGIYRKVFKILVYDLSGGKGVPPSNLFVRRVDNPLWRNPAILGGD